MFNDCIYTTRKSDYVRQVILQYDKLLNLRDLRS